MKVYYACCLQATEQESVHPTMESAKEWLMRTINANTPDQPDPDNWNGWSWQSEGNKHRFGTVDARGKFSPEGYVKEHELQGLMGPILEAFRTAVIADLDELIAEFGDAREGGYGCWDAVFKEDDRVRDYVKLVKETGQLGTMVYALRDHAHDVGEVLTMLMRCIDPSVTDDTLGQFPLHYDT